MFRLATLLTCSALATCNYPVAEEGYAEALMKLDFEAVKDDLKKMFVQSEEFWPADYGNYGPLMIRIAWHCSGSYRTSDGRGGCDGGRQRFDPERSWDDNTNLDKARRVLWPIKQKYGVGLSWGDLIILAGTTAIESMGGPVLGFCGGRIDDADGTWSLDLGPTSEQEKSAPCKVNGECKKPLGSTTVGLIYLNPEGPMGQPIPNASALEVRDTFGRMAMNDSETVSLIGGGHTFGKTHGACPDGPGASPKDDPANPWPGKCGSGKGEDAYTSGFEGPWTTNPTKWDNEYFTKLMKFEKDWQVHLGPGNKHQWRVKNQSIADKTMMMTSDISLLRDPAGTYQKIVKEFAEDIHAFENAFKHSWYKLTTRDMGPITRCVGKDVPPAQAFQYPLPKAPEKGADFDAVRTAVVEALTKKGDKLVKPDEANGKPYYGALLVHLAYQCASTFRVSDYLGGCNGARIRFSPQADWTTNTAMDKALEVLAPIKKQFGDDLSWADLIVFSANTALEEAGGKKMPFCSGRTDAKDGQGSTHLKPNGDFSLSSADALKETMTLLNLNKREMVALSARLRSPNQMGRLGFENSTWTNDAAILSNDYFMKLIDNDWKKKTDQSGLTEYTSPNNKANSTPFVMTPSDMLIKYEADLLNIARDFATDNDRFLHEFAGAWTKLMNADRFDGPTGNLCTPYTPSGGKDSSGMTTGEAAAIGAGVTALVFGVVTAAFCFCRRRKAGDRLLDGY